MEQFDPSKMTAEEVLLLNALKQLKWAREHKTAGVYKSGGSGKVIKTFDPEFGKDVALKIIGYSDRLSEAKAIVDLEREYHSLKSLHHPSIVKFLGFHHNDSTKQALIRMEWAATELSSGGSLDLGDLINQHSNRAKVHDPEVLFPESVIWQILFHVAAALALCHHGIKLHRNFSSEKAETSDILNQLFNNPSELLVRIASQHSTIAWVSEQITFSMEEAHDPTIHRDIKPKNILITDPIPQPTDDMWRSNQDISFGNGSGPPTFFQVFPVMLLGDFGLSAPLKEAHTYGVGTVNYIAPEVPKDAPRPDSPEFEWTTACDIFSLGATLRHLMSLDPEGPPYSIPSTYSETLRNLVIECLEVDARKRPTAFDLLGQSISHSNWNSTFVSPYGHLIASNFNSLLVSSWHECRKQYESMTGLKARPLSLRAHQPKIIDSTLQLLSQTPRQGKDGLRFFIGGSYVLGVSGGDDIDQPSPGTLMEKLQAIQFEWVEYSNRWVIPNGSLERLVNFRNVSAELIRITSSATMDSENLHRYTSEICRTRQRLFAILICGWGERSKFCKAILDLVDEGISDSDLPFDRVHFGESDLGNRRRSFKLSRGSHDQCTPTNHRCIIKAMQDWPQKENDQFSREQWMVLAPVFRKEPGRIPHFDLGDQILMPFKEDYENAQLHTGGYSEVWPVRICEGHQDLYQSSDIKDKAPLLAVKRLYSAHELDFKKEAGILIALTGERHPNIVELLATYKYKGKYHFVFPHAKSDLRTLWMTVPKPQHDFATYLWVLDQMTGLASGLNTIHNYPSNIAYNTKLEIWGSHGSDYLWERNSHLLKEQKFGRHGDVKAENITWLNDLDDAMPAGILQITDLGLAAFHGLESRSNVDPRTIYCSPTYAPPEVALGQRVSRAYDIWSLGCVFLEFATWLLKGSEALETFADRRSELGHFGIEDDNFYSLIVGSSTERAAVVRRSVLDWIISLHKSPRCSSMVHDLLHLISVSLLVVDSQSRMGTADLYLELKGMLNKAKSSSEYLVGKNDHAGAGRET